MPSQSWSMLANSPISGAGQGAGSAYASSATATDVSPAPQFLSQTFGGMYAGQRWRFTAYGVFSNTSTPTLNLGFYYGGVAGTPLITTGTVTTTTAASSWWWQIQACVEIRSTGSSGTAWSQGYFDNPTSSTAVTRLQMSATSQTATI